MPEKNTETKKKKITVKKPRKRSASAKIAVKRKRASSEHVVDLKMAPGIAPEMIDSVETFESPAPEEVTAIQERVPVETTPRWPFSLYKRIAITFAAVVLLGLAAAAYFAFVRLEIVITPRVEAVTAAAPFNVYDRPESYELPAGAILGLVREMEVESTASYPATGSEVTGAEVSGTVTIVNNYSKDQPLVATTRLLTPTNQLLRLRETVLVPAGGSVEAEVYGETADPSFTLADTRLTIPGLWAGLQDQIYAEAEAGDVSYQQQQKLTITQADVDRALEETKRSLIAKATREIDATYSAYDQKLYELDETSIIFTVDGKAGEEKPQVTVSMSASVTVVAFKNDSVANLDDSALASALGDDQSLIDSSATAPVFKVLSADINDNVAEVELEAHAEATAAPTAEVVDRQKLVGLTEGQVRSYLDGLPSIESYELRFSPSFLKVAPQLADRINVRIRQ